MTLDQAGLVLCAARDAALTCYGNQLLQAGLTVEDEEFSTKMMSYARQLEGWRAGALSRIAAGIEEILQPPGTLH